MNIMIYGNSGSGKTTLGKILARYGYVHINTGEITRMMAAMDCHNLPVIVQAMVESMDRNKRHCFDHFYIHTYKQLRDLGMEPLVVELLDKRSVTHTNSAKRDRWATQSESIEGFFSLNEVKRVKVYNTDYGFDLSELIKAGYLPFDTFAMEEP